MKRIAKLPFDRRLKLSCYPLLPRYAEEESGPLDKALHSRSAFLRAERGHQRAGPLSFWPQPAPGTIVLQSRGGSRSPRTI